MSGFSSGAQTRIREEEPLPTCVHRVAHSIHPVLNDTVKSILEMKQFYDTIENMYMFFGHMFFWY